MAENKQEEINKAYYAIIPATVRYDKDIPPNAKLLYGEITALCNQKGYCWATNEYFSNLYKCTKQSVSSWISKLKEKGYISVEMIYKEGSKEILNRYIKIIEYPIQNNLNTPIQNNLKDNNTSFNNTSNNTVKKKERKNTSYDEILSSVEDDSLRETYLEYIKMRKLIKSPMTDKALKLLINKVNKLEPYSIERQKQLLENAIEGNWKSVYPLKDSGSNKKASYDIEELEKIDFFDTKSSNPFLELAKEEAIF